MKYTTYPLQLIIVLALSVNEAKSQLNSNNFEALDTNELNIGDTAPGIYISKWLVGKAPESKKQARPVVIEFWATWCGPCLKGFATFNKVAKKYKKEIDFISINVLQKKNYPIEKAIHIVDSIKDKMRLHFSIGIEETNKMTEIWIDKIWDAGVPLAIVIDSSQEISWIGHPLDLEKTIAKINSGNWDKTKERKVRIDAYQLYQLDNEVRELVMPHFSSGSAADYYGNPDSVLAIINTWLHKEPRLAFQHSVVFHKFIATMKNDMDKAALYADSIMTADTNNYNTVYEPILLGIKYIIAKHFATPKIYSIGGKILENYSNSNAGNLSLASNWYWMGGNKKAAIRCSKKARKAMKKATTNNYGTFF